MDYQFLLFHSAFAKYLCFFASLNPRGEGRGRPFNGESGLSNLHRVLFASVGGISFARCAIGSGRAALLAEQGSSCPVHTVVVLVVLEDYGLPRLVNREE